jgi:DNA-directed RNA polymerase specialized sigma24 family protein
VHKFSLCEISEILGIREGTVSSRLFYACRKLGQEMAVDDFKDLIAEFQDE